jgi:hypothetical protein
MDEASVDPLLAGRNETPLQRCDRNLVELLQEVRVIQTGVQVLFAFLLTAPLATRFPVLTPTQRLEYFASLLAAGAAAVFLVAPTAYHRILFRLGDKEHLVTTANRFTIVGLIFVAAAMLGSLLLVTDLLFSGAVTAVTLALALIGVTWCWCAAPLLRRRRVRQTPERDIGARPWPAAPDGVPALSALRRAPTRTARPAPDTAPPAPRSTDRPTADRAGRRRAPGAARGPAR